MPKIIQIQVKLFLQKKNNESKYYALSTMIVKPIFVDRHYDLIYYFCPFGPQS